MIDDGSCPEGHSAVDLYFLQDDGSSFKATILYEPYFYIYCKVGSQENQAKITFLQTGTESDVEEYIRRKFSKYLHSLSIIEKEDLKLVSKVHLI